MAFGNFCPSTSEKGASTARTVNLAPAKMCLRVVSTCRIIDALQQLPSPEICLSHTQVRRTEAEPDKGLKAWQLCPLRETPYLFLAAYDEKVRWEGRIIDYAVCIAGETESSDKRRMLDDEFVISEVEINWRRFLGGILSRRLKGVHLVIADDHAEPKAACRSVLSSRPWLQSPFHLHLNATPLVTPTEALKTVAAPMRVFFNVHDRMEAERPMKVALGIWRREHPQLAKWAEETIPERLTVFGVLAMHRMRLPATNGPARINRKRRHRTRVTGILPNLISCSRHVSTLLAKLDDEPDPQSLLSSSREPRRHCR